MNKTEFLQELENKINLFYPILSINNNEDNLQEALFYSHNGDNRTSVKLMNEKELESFNEIINFAFSYSNISLKYSEAHIINQITILFHNLLKDKTNISDDISNLYTDITNNGNDQWFIVSEIENIRLYDNRSFKLIDCTIGVLEESNLPSDIHLEDQVDSRVFDCVGQNCIYTNVIAGDIEKAKILANENFKISFNLLRLYVPNFKPVIKGTLVLGIQEISVYNMSKRISIKCFGTTNTPPNE